MDEQTLSTPVVLRTRSIAQTDRQTDRPNTNGAEVYGYNVYIGNLTEAYNAR